MTSELKEKIAEFPISEHLEEICTALKDSPSRYLILTAETAAGKSTVLPLALLENFPGKIIMTEPRRLAVLGVANRLSELSQAGEAAADQIGYKIHLESHITKDTRLEVVTEAILVRQLQEDPALENYKLVILDEFHERSVNTDLALAFLKEAMQLRDDLFIVIMSATIETSRLQKYLADDSSKTASDRVPLLAIPGRQYPVKILYEPEKSLLSIIYQAIRTEKEGNILVFLPGISDIRRAQEELLESGDFGPESDFEICLLHSSISLEEQKRVLKPCEKRRIILSSAIAETSLTVPGVTTVIDSGLSRINRLDINTGLQRLCTESESEFSAQQRAGRAGRLCPGTCFRQWGQNDPRVRDLAPEILRTDLLPLVLECSERGVYTVDGIDWLDLPVTASWRASIQLLVTLGMLRASDSRIMPRGRAALNLGLHPRLAGIALDSFDFTSCRLSAHGKELLLKFSNYAHSSPDLQRRFIADLEGRLKRVKGALTEGAAPAKGDLTKGGPATVSGTPVSGTSVNAALAGGAASHEGALPPKTSSLSENPLLILSGYPDRLAKRLSDLGVEPAEYQFAGGRKALMYTQNKRAPLWLVAPEVMTTEKGSVIFDFEELGGAELEGYLEQNANTRVKCRFSDGRIIKTEEKCFGEIVLFSRKISASAQDLAAAWLGEITEKGFDALPLDPKIEGLLLRGEFILQEGCAQTLGQLEVKETSSVKEALAQEETVKQWLLPFLAGASSLNSKILYDALYWYLDGSEIDRLAPEMLTLENGRRCKVKYENQGQIRPVIEIIIQRIFGSSTNPQICGKKVLLRLLSPASRPLQVTDDLEHFWTGAWVEICKEMKGRYPKHNWDYRLTEKE
ncbi:MAG: DEAD/DEAH box helicase [Treponema sp.]|nr:DEAD/DEAH box helicase [Treponema sp.]